MGSAPLPTRIPKQFSFGKVPQALCINTIYDHKANPSLSNGCRTWSQCQTFM
jgi:hypothetical protein